MTPRAGVTLSVFFGSICFWQCLLYFTAPRENWESAASVPCGRSSGACTPLRILQPGAQPRRLQKSYHGVGNNAVYDQSAEGDRRGRISQAPVQIGA
jgi:hypothetical protein